MMPFFRNQLSRMGIVLLFGLSLNVWAVDAMPLKFEPVDTSTVSGHKVKFAYYPSNGAVYNSIGEENTNDNVWYRNGSAIAGANNSFSYVFTPTMTNNNDTYYCIATGYTKAGSGGLTWGPTQTKSGKLTVFPVGTTYPPLILTPAAGAKLIWFHEPTYPEQYFTAQGNYIKWSYRFSNEPIGQWHTLSTDFDGLQGVFLQAMPPIPHPRPTTMTVRVTDDAGVSAERTWEIDIPNSPPVANSIWYAPPFYIAYIGQTMVVDKTHGLSVGVIDDDGDPLTFVASALPGLVMHLDGSFTYTPPATLAPTKFTPSNFSQNTSVTPIPNISFQYTVSDGSVTATGAAYLNYMTGAGDINRDGAVTNADTQMVLDKAGNNGTIPLP